jgi:hypothetical protein
MDGCGDVLDVVKQKMREFIAVMTTVRKKDI